MAARADPDPPSQLRTLAAGLSAGNHLARGYVLRGEERWFREQAILQITRSAGQRGLEIVKHDASDPDFDARSLGSDLSAAPMFAPARCILVRNAGAFLKKEDGEDSRMTRAVLAFLGDRELAGCLVIDADALRADHAVCKAVAELGGPILSLRRLWDSPPHWDPDPRKAELVQWLLARARERRIGLDAGEAAYVAAATGNDLSALDGALDRLAQRGRKSVREIVGWTGGASPFQLAEDLCRGDAARALSGIEALFRSGFQDRDGSRELDPNALLAILFGSLRGKLRQTLSGALALERGEEIGAAAQGAGVSAGPKARLEFEARVKSRSPAAWQAMLEELTDLERRTRTGARVDANDFALLALRWRRTQGASAAQR